MSERSPGTAEHTVTGVVAVVGLLVFFELTSGLLQGATNPLLPSIQSELGVPSAQLHWVHAVQYLAAAVSVPIFGRLGDLYGYRRMLRVALLFITVGSVVVALAPDLTVLLVGRALLGPLAALLPLEIGLVRDRLSPEQSRRAIGMLVGSLTLGSLLGALVAGMVQGLVGDVRVTLALLAALAVACLALSYFRIPESRNRAEGGMDWRGGVLLGLALVALLGSISQGNTWGWTSPLFLGGLVAAAVLFAVWVRLELRTEHPLVDVAGVASAAVAPHYFAGAVLGVVLLGGQSGIVLYLSASPEDVGYGFGLGVMALALAVILPSATAFVGASTIAAVAGRLGYRRTVFVAFSLIAGGLTGMAFAWQLLPLFLGLFTLVGLGCGMALGALPTLVVEASAADRAGSASAVFNNLKTLGGSVGGAVSAGVLGYFLTAGTDEPALLAYQGVWWGVAVLSLATAFVAGRARKASA
ncbi:MFS transporter [Nocardiopsis terrae]|uniref:MFS family permease n=1 Tax=Nocardiopsis terrae TaxID=372655 RepID=A0ABR9HNX2_9ACTN|nr:MFS transporter [Nocardiopsis terrae]MBE1460712.1 MFS family permease [Nocardiopsis terrae]GHC73053.1 MFS transporter [Nocardiopsis terrae]